MAGREGPALTNDELQRGITEFEAAQVELEAFFHGLSDAQLDAPVWDEGIGWRVRDLLPHIARWQRMAAQAARLIAGGREPLPEGQMLLRTFVGITESVDDVNHETYQSWRERPIADRFGELHEAHAELMAALRALPLDRIIGPDGRPHRYFWQPGINHLRQHREHVATALAKEGAST